MAEDNNFPGWMGPIVGPIVGGAIAFYTFANEPNGSMGLLGGTAMGAVFGLVAGLVVWRMDARKRKNQEGE